ncbi:MULTISPECIES: flagellar motor protein MotB [Metabacillus]|uniref:Flagellar motor protein MotB n=1 Tax=Metabacillus hrfriensis TaxID=3048891 RepID=A0ACD4RG04_9BACI|nr:MULTISPECIES: flagellar motor protein MotB [Metabacillus]UAL53900.1 flagellar motor protein MotB [Metabacillus dongyingensis]UOK59297.1 flagellar motor protein MotB [Bacillus sp. OVS6]USK30212.1 flagellar motor protein MotB [Bacillus sp. CMF21]WHZ59458.1 flagellar motor protein MotB [Metabacillus sp. CT-WN-B3]
MARKKKQKNEEEHVDESWLLPYADLLTLLLALFIVLFAMSSVDAQKFQMLARAFNSTFTGGTGVLEYPSPIPDGEMEKLDQEKEKNPDKEKQETLEQEKLKEIQKKVNAYIAANSLETQLKTTLTDEGLLITILNDIFFDSGNSSIRKKDEQLAKEISKLLVMNPPRNIIVSGHTDNVPIQNAEFESNWHLSVMRAVNFMKLLLENGQLDPRAFSAKGFGEYNPVADNKTKEGQQKNRRVEILILPIEQNQ